MMPNSTQTKVKEKATQEDSRRAEEASIVTGLRQILDSNEQLLGFARGRLAGGIRGKMNLGPEAFFAPFVNIGLTERRVVISIFIRKRASPARYYPTLLRLANCRESPSVISRPTARNRPVASSSVSPMNKISVFACAARPISNTRNPWQRSSGH